MWDEEQDGSADIPIVLLRVCGGGHRGQHGLFEMRFVGEFYVYFTNLSNYLCAGIMLAELIQTARRREDGYVTVAPRLKFIAMLALLLTFMVFNLLLAGDPARDPKLNYTPACVLNHIVLPIMFMADWFLFYERGSVTWKWPFLSTLCPLAYLGFVYIHAALRRFDTSMMNYAGTDPLIYPYFFLNPERVGIGGILTWIGMLLVAFIAGGFAFMLIDRGLRRIFGRKG